MIEVVVVTRNSAEHVGACIDSVVAAGALPIIVDNDSTDGTLEIVRSRYPEAKVVALPENLGYGRALNLAFKGTSGDIVIFSNPDVVFRDNSISQMVRFLEANQRVGITAPQQIFPNQSWQASYGDLPGIWSGIKDIVGITTIRNAVRRALWPRRLDRKPKGVPYVDGAVLAVRRKAFLEIAGFDEDFFLYSEEADLCARLRKADWRVVFLPAAEVIHVRGASDAKDDRGERRIRYIVEGQALLASKHLPPWKVRVYRKLQIGRVIRLRLTYRLLNFFDGNNSSNSHKIWMFGIYRRAWKEMSARPQGTLTSKAGPSRAKEPANAN